TYNFLFCLRGREHDLGKLGQPLLLLRDQHRRITNQIDKQDMANLESKIVLGFRYRHSRDLQGPSPGRDSFRNFSFFEQPKISISSSTLFLITEDILALTSHWEFLRRCLWPAGPLGHLPPLHTSPSRLRRGRVLLFRHPPRSQKCAGVCRPERSSKSCLQTIGQRRYSPCYRSSCCRVRATTTCSCLLRED